jgi:hypothetical protein
MKGRKSVFKKADSFQIEDSSILPRHLDRYFSILQKISALQNRILGFLRSFEFYLFVHVIEPAVKTIKLFFAEKDKFDICKLKLKIGQMFDFIWKNLFLDEASAAVFDLVMKVFQSALDFVNIAESFDNFMIFSENWEEDLENCDLIVLKVRLEFSKAVEFLFRVLEEYTQKGLDIPCNLISRQAHQLRRPQLGKVA